MDKEEFEKRGMHNWKNLFRKPTLQDWIIFFMLIMLFVMSWAYKRDVQLCQETLKNLQTTACSICNAGV